MTRLLDGIRVIDAANFIAGPVSTTMMADFGADVIKVEPPTGDVYRVRGAGYPASPYNYPWIVDNRTKRSGRPSTGTAARATRSWRSCSPSRSASAAPRRRSPSRRTTPWFPGR